MKQKYLLLGVLAILTLTGSNVIGQGVAATRLQTRVSGLSSPIFVTNAADGTKRLFVVERAGIIKVVQPGSNVTTNFLNITAKTSTDGERGLLGLAFHPNYETNRRFFVYYTRVADGAIQIAEYQASLGNSNVADTTETPIITVAHPGQSNHNGGTLAFGADGYLYIGTGDGGGGNDPLNNAQNINQLLGKMLRLDINASPGQTAPYLIPPTNPFVSSAGADEIFAVGLRNPFRWSFDRGGTNQLWLADVGQGAFEEVDIITNGGNYGWRVYEGTQCTGLDTPLCTPANFVPPVFQYSSANPSSRCAITGGYVYRGTQGTLPDGSYVYGDYCTGEVLLWQGGQQLPLLDVVDFNLTSFGEDEDGELYIVQIGTGIIQKIVPAKASADFDADFRTDFSVFRPSTGFWHILNGSTGAIRSQQFGINNDIPAAEDYDGDRRTDLAVFRPSDGNWYYIRSSDSTYNIINFGVPGDIPVAGDYDGDAKADIAVFRPSNGNWYRRLPNSTFVTTNWGVSGDVPVHGDYDGDGKYDVAVWRPSDGFWYVIFSTNSNFLIQRYGEATDLPAPGDFDGDGRNDLALFRPSTGQWFLKRSFGNIFQNLTWGINGDVPVVGDYDNDGRDDVAIFRPSTGSWWVVGSTVGIINIPSWGVATDITIPAKDNP